MTMLLEMNCSSGSSPDSELWERLRCSRPLRLPRDGDMCPSRPLEASETSVIFMSALQVMPSHVQQFVSFCHDTARPPSFERPARNWRRNLFSWSVQELVEEAKHTITRANPRRLKKRRNRDTTSSMASTAVSSDKKELEALPTIDAGEVREFMSSGHHYLDVRLAKDFDKAHADGARNISYYLSVTPSGKEKNPHFVDEVAALFSKDEHLIVGCNTGVRSRLATKDLLDAGFKNVRNLKGGYQSFLRSESQQSASDQQ
uniref:Rhodanese domain-containing protein n=1 Tax=Leersia perrieri TaxID=77586 RepID=A0A0D9VCD9_9ORYZ